MTPPLHITVMLGGPSAEREVSLRSGAAVARAPAQPGPFGHRAGPPRPRSGPCPQRRAWSSWPSTAPTARMAPSRPAWTNWASPTPGAILRRAAWPLTRSFPKNGFWRRVCPQPGTWPLTRPPPRGPRAGCRPWSSNPPARAPAWASSSLTASRTGPPLWPPRSSSTPESWSRNASRAPRPRWASSTARSCPSSKCAPGRALTITTTNTPPGPPNTSAPPRWTPATTRRVQEAGLAAFHAVGGRDYARVDVMIRPDGSPVVLEVNTLPGMTETSLLPKAAAQAGLDFPRALRQNGRDGFAPGAGPTPRVMNLFKRKPKNRRQDRQEVLRVKLGLRDQRRRQSRAAILFATVSLAAALIVYGLYRGGEYSLDRFVYHNKAYALLELDVDTDGVLSLEQLRRWAGVKLQDNLFTLDLARIKRDIELCSAVQSAAVERILPHTLRIRVCERIPVAQLLAPSLRSDQGQQPGCYQLDAAGWVILPLAPSQRAQPAAADEALPLITGMPATPVRPGRQIESAPVRAALELITTFEHSPHGGQSRFAANRPLLPGHPAGRHGPEQPGRLPLARPGAPVPSLAPGPRRGPAPSQIHRHPRPVGLGQRPLALGRLGRRPSRRSANPQTFAL